MSLPPSQITIAITVYDRRDFIQRAIRSALGQTLPVRVIVVEDGGPDRGLEGFVKAEFGDRLTYFRNPVRRGLFDNWNACVERCSTEWLSILHDDDYLEPTFAATMVELAAAAPGKDLYFGETRFETIDGRALPSGYAPVGAVWREIDPRAIATTSPFPFPGQLFRVAAARRLGGFRAASQYCGDWELWFRLTLEGGAAQAGRVVGVVREHGSATRGTTLVQRRGSVYALVNANRKRNLALLRARGMDARFDRRQPECQEPWVARLLVRNADTMSDRLLRYNLGLLWHSQPGRAWMKAYRWLAAAFGPRFARQSARWFKHRDSAG